MRELIIIRTNSIKNKKSAKRKDRNDSRKMIQQKAEVDEHASEKKEETRSKRK